MNCASVTNPRFIGGLLVLGVERGLWHDPASGIMRHADAGYETAAAFAREHGLKLPSVM
ncbi:MAG TPA: hypothetical protein VJN67_16015 [Stellaceae bacterium]|nr:hypothetical protein [Stellaceae bacterium]